MCTLKMCRDVANIPAQPLPQIDANCESQGRNPFLISDRLALLMRKLKKGPAGPFIFV